MEPGFDIVQTIYCSRASNFENKPQFERDIYDILNRSNAYNTLHEITGALMTDGTMFAQVIEGPSAAVGKLCYKMVHDERHKEVLTLQHTMTHVRLFHSWPLAFLRVGAIPHVQALNAQSTPAELRKASVSILKAFRPILLR